MGALILSLATEPKQFMARRVFFSFHYEDVWRVNQIRNSWVVLGKNETAGFIDKAQFEKVERQGSAAIKAWINQQLKGTTVTIVLVGQETSNRPYVTYEILQSYHRGNGLLGINIHSMKNADGETDWFAGPNPFNKIKVDGGFWGKVSLSSMLSIPIYDWVDDNGRTKIAKWIESAPRKTE